MSKIFGEPEIALQLTQINYFLALCEARSFTKAAKRCGISQPSLSTAIKALEHELSATLIQRAPFALTPAGKAIRPHFRAILRHIYRAQSAGPTAAAGLDDGRKLSSVANGQGKPPVILIDPLHDSATDRRYMAGART